MQNGGIDAVEESVVVVGREDHHQLGIEGAHESPRVRHAPSRCRQGAPVTVPADSAAGCATCSTAPSVSELVMGIGCLPSSDRGHVEQRGAHLGCELGDARARDAPVGPQEQHGLGVAVEERLQGAGAVADDGDLRIVVPGPVQLGQGSGGDERRSQGLPPRERDVAEDRPGVVVPAEYGEPWADDVVEEDVLGVTRVDARLDEQRAGRRGRPTGPRRARWRPGRSGASA